MTPSQRSFNLAMIARLAPRAAERWAQGDARGRTIAAALGGVIARLQDELDRSPAEPVDAPPDPVGTSAPRAADPGEAGWQAVVFRAGGMFDPWAGSERDAMLASAVTCRALGAAGAAIAFEARAATLGASPTPADDFRARIRASAAAMALRPPPEAAPFQAGPQLALFG